MILAPDLNAEGSDEFLDKAVKLLDNIERIDRGGEILYQLLGQRINHAELQIIDLIAESVLGVNIRDARGDNTYPAAVILNGIQFTCLGKLGELPAPLLDHDMAADGVCGHHNILRDILNIGFKLDILRLMQLNKALRMRNSR